ncbi:MAG: restriction endonuclease [Acidimicrobiia bacterium]
MPNQTKRGRGPSEGPPCRDWQEGRVHGRGDCRSARIPRSRNLQPGSDHEHVGTRFKGHELARLVDEVLVAHGYVTQRSPAGPDGGVDVLGGLGPMGFDGPKLCVQVKSSDAPVDARTVRELQGVMSSFGADRGLLVAWGGFNKGARDEARRLFFQIRLWDSDDLIRQVLQHYDKLPAETEAEIPLTRIWALVQKET